MGSVKPIIGFFGNGEYFFHRIYSILIAHMLWLRTRRYIMLNIIEVLKIIFMDMEDMESK